MSAEPGMDLGDPMGIVGGLGLGQQGRALLVRHQHGFQQASGLSGASWASMPTWAARPGIFDFPESAVQQTANDLQQGWISPHCARSARHDGLRAG